MIPSAAICVAAAVWLVAAAVSCLPLLTPPGRRPSLAEAGVALVLGTAATGVALALLRAAGAPNDLARRVLLTAFVGHSMIVIWRRGRNVVPVFAPATAPERISTTVILLMWLSPQLVGAMLMGTGAYPAVFFNVDTSFRMIHVHELLRENGFPPLSLANLDGRPANHLAAPGVAAALSLISGLAPHASLFAAALPVAALGVFCAMFRLAQTVAVGRQWWCVAMAFAYMLAAWPWPSFDFLRTSLAAMTGDSEWRRVLEFAVRLLDDRQSFNNYFEDATHLFGRALLLISARPLLSANDDERDAWAAAVAVVLLGQVKSGPAFLAAVLFGVASAGSLVRTRRLSAGVLPLLAAGGAFGLMRLGGVDTIVGMTIEPWWMLRNYPTQVWRDLLNAGILVLLPLAPILICRCWPRTRTWQRSATQVLAGVCLVYVVYNLVGAYWNGGGWVTPPQRVPFEPFLHPVTYMPTLFAAGSMLVLMRMWPELPRRQRRISTAIVLALALPAFLHRAEGAWYMVTAPEYAHEYADNRSIAAALSVIPLTAVVATNDLRYPAEQYGRDLRQFQIAAVFGHQAYAIPGYERYPGWEDRVALQRRIRDGDLSCMVWRALHLEGVTHLLMHWRAPGPTRVDPTPLYIDAAYGVYDVGQAIASCSADPN